MATGNEMMMESVKLVEDIIGELRGFDETPPPKRVWLDIANRLENALVNMDGYDFCDMFRRLSSVQWEETVFLDLQTYCAGNGVYILRCKHGESNEHYCIINALDENEAISRAVFDLRKPSERIGNVGNLRNVLSTVSAWLNNFVIDGKPRDDTYSASELKCRVDEALNSRVRNCDRFHDSIDAQIAFLNEVWLISVDRDSMLVRDKFDNWTPDMKARYVEWLMEKKEGTDKNERQ